MIVLVTGGAGFIGSNYVKHLLKNKVKVVVLDALTYAGNLENLSSFLTDDAIIVPSSQATLSTIRIDEYGQVNFDGYEKKMSSYKLDSWLGNRIPIKDVGMWISDILLDSNLVFVYGNIVDGELVDQILPLCDGVVNFAAETHVDRSILNPDEFIKTDVYGTYALLESVKKCDTLKKFVHVSTDEVYGVATEKSFTETDPINPRNPYSASKAAADRLVYAYHQTYQLPVNIVRPSNNYGSHQYPEKLIPVMIIKALNNEALPIYGGGRQVRDWLFVDDTVKAIDSVLRKADSGEVYNIAGGNERENIDVVKHILHYLGKSEHLIKHVEDRPGHDTRYSLDDSKIRKELSFTQKGTFEDDLDYTIQWYLDNTSWWRKTIEDDKEYKEFMTQWYASRT